ncbi:MAG: hypothetical protein E7264_03345 [Lachnospiraceae bacterium]|nr:hypothetical protein [Lachnospiraceae bacterium]
MEKIRLQILLNEDKHLGEQEIVKMAIELLTQMQRFQEMQRRFCLLTPNTINVILKPSVSHYSYELSDDVELLSGEPMLYGPWMDEAMVEEADGVTTVMYSLGIVMYQLLNDNKLPFVELDTTYKQRMEKMKQRHYKQLPKLTGCNDGLLDVMRRACHYDKTQRYQRITDMLDDLQSVEKELLLKEKQAVKSKQAMQMGSLLHGRYQIKRVIGSGGFGITYEAWDEKMSVHVAIKEYLPKSIAIRSANKKEVSILTYSDNMEYRRGLERFIEEAKTLVQFSSNPVVVNVFDYFEENNTAYIVMEYLEGHSLSCELKEKGIFPVEKGVVLMKTLALSLAAIHEKGIVHRDINPDNVFICPDGTVRLLDFGAAKYVNQDGKRSKTVIVTPQYAPIEQFQQDSQVSAKMDIYALGATMYKVLTGITPLSAIDRVGEDGLILPKECIDGFDSDVQGMLLKCMAFDAARRYDTMMDIVQALENIAAREKNKKI